MTRRQDTLDGAAVRELTIYLGDEDGAIIDIAPADSRDTADGRRYEARGYPRRGNKACYGRTLAEAVDAYRRSLEETTT